MLRIYIDNNILSRLACDDWPDPRDREVVSSLWDYKEASLVASPVTYKEIEAADENTKKRLKEFADQLILIHLPEQLSLGNVSFGGRLGATQDAVLTELRRIFTPAAKSDSSYKLLNSKGKQLTNDADHINHALKTGCDFFLTLDNKTIMKRYKRNQEKVDLLLGGMRIVDPQTLRTIILGKN
jgi:predicted nucleic acid-binding protein